MNEDLDEIMRALDECTSNYSAQQIVGELGVVIERLGFAQFDAQNLPSHDELVARLQFLLERDVSPGVMAFVERLATANHIGILLRDAGQMFLAYCETHYNDLKQLTFKSAIILSGDFQATVRDHILSGYPQGTRLIFVAEPGIGAGFQILDGMAIVVDASLRDKISPLLLSFIKNRRPMPWTNQ
jgi:hypothetical protein